MSNDNGKKTVIVADDEQLICELLKSVIDWNGLGLELIGVAYNGQELYQAILDKHPDIVVTDISMPQMDGIALIGKIRKEGIPCHFVIVSGYRQFEYAHNALKYDVEDYILKPVDAKELNDALKKLSDKISEEENNRELKPLISDNKKLLRRFFLNNGIQKMEEQHLTIDDIESEYGISFKEGLFRIIYVKSDYEEQMEDYAENSSSIQNKICVTFEDMFCDICSCVLMDWNFETLKIAINYPMDMDNEVDDRLKNYFERIRNFADLFKDYQLTIGVGNSYTNVAYLKKSEEEAYASIGSRMVMGCDRIIYWKNVKQSERILDEEQKREYIRNLKKSFELLEIDSFKEQMKMLFREVHNRFSFLPLMDFLAEVLELFLQTEKTLFPEQINEDYIRKQFFYGVRGAVSLLALQKAIVKPISEAMESLVQLVEQQNKKPIRMAFAYVEENYSKQIRLEDVALQVDLNPVYFSNVFKKETGENFTDYLTNYRMEVAKELLRNTNDSINEIAEKTGYLDNRYFSKLFKKSVGIKPSEYRKIYG